SHSMGTIKSFCNKAILIDKGQVLAVGEVKEIAERYENMVNQEVADMKLVESLDRIVVDDKRRIDSIVEVAEDMEFQKRASQFRSGTGEAKFLRADLMVDGKVTDNVPFGALVTIRLVAQYYIDVDTEGTIGYMVRNHN